MRQLRPCERGSANWPFIITLILLLAFVYMWWDEKDQKEQAQLKEAASAEAETAARNAATTFLNYAGDLSEMVGFTEMQPAELFTAPATDAEPQAKADYELGVTLAGSRPLTSKTMLKAHLDKDGADGDGNPGMLRSLFEVAKVNIVRDIRAESGEGGEEKPANFEWMTPDFKRKLAEVSAFQIPPKPKPVQDPDDEGEVARNEAEMRAYEEAMARLQQMNEELQAMEGYKQWEGVIKPPRRFSPDERTIVELGFFTQPPVERVTIERLLRLPTPVIQRVIAELKVNKETDSGLIDQLRGQVTARDETITSLEGDLRSSQEAHNTEVDQLNRDLQTAGENLEAARLESSGALQQVEQLKDDMQRKLAKLGTENSALKNRIRLDKDERDLVIRRDDPDGEVLTGSPTMGTAIINIGSTSKVFPGLKFNVSYIGRGGHRVPKGQIMVTRVLGRNTSKAEILGTLSAGNPIGQGDIIHNPLFDASQPIHVWLAGELDKYPLDIAKARLRKLGVILDAELNSDTDYVVIPNAMSAPAPSEDEEDEEDEDSASVGLSEFDRIEKLARTFGATVITERMLNQFLDY